MTLRVRRTALRGPQQTATVTLALGSVHGPKCPLPLVASVDVALPVRGRQRLPLTSPYPTRKGQRSRSGAWQGAPLR